MMHLNCPHCHQFIEVVNDHELETPVTCPSCGSEWKTWDTETATFRTAPVVTVGRFELLNRLGQGQFGEVWSARDPKLDRQVAIKLPRKEALDDTDIERFLREARAAAQLHHPNIVGVLEVGEEGRSLYIVSDLIQGVNLADRMVMGWKPSFQETAQLCLTLAEALEHAHSKGVIHRDLKPANVMVDNKNQIFLTDFGLAKRQAGEITMTIEGRIFGTPAYMPPEQARGDGHNADARSDVYSLGVMLFELLTGQRPFKGGSQMLIHQILTQDPSPLRRINPNVPVDMQTICIKCLEKDPAQRYQTAQEVADELRRYLAGESIHARPTPLTTRLSRWAKRNRKLALSLAASLGLACLLGVVGADNLRRRHEDLPVVHNVTIKTYPSGARVVATPLDTNTGEPQWDKTVRLSDKEGRRLEAKDYLVTASISKDRFIEVFRRVPRMPTDQPDVWPHLDWEWGGDDSVELPLIIIPAVESLPQNLVKVEGGSIKMVPPLDEMIPEPLRTQLLKEHPARRQTESANVRGFFVSKREFSRADAVQAVSLRVETLAKVNSGILDGKRGEIRIQSVPDALGDLGLTVDDTVNQLPLTDVDYNEAVFLAEAIGCRLLTEEEYVFSATNRSKTKYTWGDSDRELNLPPQDLAIVDSTFDPRGISGLCSGVGEWTSSWPISYPAEPQLKDPRDVRDNRVIRGHDGIGLLSQLSVAPAGRPIYISSRLNYLMSFRDVTVGFRTARSDAPKAIE